MSPGVRALGLFTTLCSEVRRREPRARLTPHVGSCGSIRGCSISRPRGREEADVLAPKRERWMPGGAEKIRSPSRAEPSDHLSAPEHPTCPASHLRWHSQRGNSPPAPLDSTGEMRTRLSAVEIQELCDISVRARLSARGQRLGVWTYRGAERRIR